MSVSVRNPSNVCTSNSSNSNNDSKFIKHNRSNSNIKTRASSRHLVSSIISSFRKKYNSDKDKYNFILGFTDPKYQSAKIAREYVAFKRSDSSIAYIVFVLATAFAYLVENKSAAYYEAMRTLHENNAILLFGFIAAAVALFFLILLFCQRLIILLEDSALSRNCKKFNCSFFFSCRVSNMSNFYNSHHVVRVVEDGIIILGALGSGLKLYAAKSNHILIFIVNMIVVLVTQVVVKSGSRTSLCLGWAIVIAFVNYSISDLSYSTVMVCWMNIILLFLMR